MRLCTALKKPTDAHSAFETVRNAGDEELRLALETIAPMNYLGFVEPLFLIRPDTPVSMQALHSQDNGQPERFRRMLSAICTHLMEILIVGYQLLWRVV